MRFRAFSASNFRAITSVALTDLQDVVVVAGPNGCGKSCVIDALRLLKSAYGGYQPNEYESWFGEFQINLNRPEELRSIMQNPDNPLTLHAEITLSAEERQYLRSEARQLATRQAWHEVAPELHEWQTFGSAPVAAHLRAHTKEVDETADVAEKEILQELESDVFVAHLSVQGDGTIEAQDSRVLEVLFSTYEPAHLGIIDYHGANRHYGREQVGGINLSIESSGDLLRKHALYNYANKYSNLKNEMAASYVRALLAKEAGLSPAGDTTLTETLRDLFATFFPGKAFLGPTPTSDGRLLFPVRTPSGAMHDINDLSSGEKEVLYGYLRLRNSAPKNSVLLIDEPELHLNPRLMRGLASFYHRHLGKPLNNQLWLVTHSDTLIRDAVGRSEFRVFHMHPASPEISQQATPVTASEHLEAIVVDLVGDLAAYRPGAKIAIFEGGGDSEFDVRLVNTLFPEFQSAVNAISGGGKSRVRDLYETLDRIAKDGHLPARFYSVCDRDYGQPQSAGSRYLEWDAYHIENYLLEPQFICTVLNELNLTTHALTTEHEVNLALAAFAEETIASQVRHHLERYANSALLDSLKLGTDPNAESISDALRSRLEAWATRVQHVMSDSLSADALRTEEHQLRSRFENELKSGDWKKTFRGRDILRRFVGVHGRGKVNYEAFRNLIAARMREMGFKPPGMATVLNRILDDPAWSATK